MMVFTKVLFMLKQPKNEMLIGQNTVIHKPCNEKRTFVFRISRSG